MIRILRDRKITPPSETEKTDPGASVLPADFQIPDLSFLEKGGESAGETRLVSRFIFEHRGKTYLAEITFASAKNDLQPNILAKIDFDVKDMRPADGSERVGGFHCLLTRGPMIEKYRKDNNNDSFCGVNINYRYIIPEYRGQGLSALSLEAIEEITKKISFKYPKLNLKCIEVYTSLASITRLLADKQWLEEHGLGQYQRHGKNMGYQPDEQDIEMVQSVLAAGLSSIDEMVADNVVPNDIRLVKNISK